MKLHDIHQDGAALAELGNRLARIRIDMRMTQAELAKEAGVSKRTLERLEAGDPTQTPTLMRVLRVLGLLEGLDAVIPEVGLRPMHIVKESRGLPKRVRKKKKLDGQGAWKWGDEK